MFIACIVLAYKCCSIQYVGHGLQAAGEKLARVIGAPKGSECAEQCDQVQGSKIGLSDITDGCARTDTTNERICVITSPETCKGFPIQEFTLPDDDDFVAACEVGIGDEQ